MSQRAPQAGTSSRRCAESRTQEVFRTRGQGTMAVTPYTGNAGQLLRVELAFFDACLIHRSAAEDSLSPEGAFTILRTLIGIMNRLPKKNRVRVFYR